MSPEAAPPSEYRTLLKKKRKNLLYLWFLLPPLFGKSLTKSKKKVMDFSYIFSSSLLFRSSLTSIKFFYDFLLSRRLFYSLFIFTVVLISLSSLTRHEARFFPFFFSLPQIHSYCEQQREISRSSIVASYISFLALFPFFTNTAIYCID